MSAYILALVELDDALSYGEYARRALPLIEQFGGEILARGGETQTLEGQLFSGRVVVIRFPSLQRIREFYASSEYQDARRLREPISRARMIAVQGVS